MKKEVTANRYYENYDDFKGSLSQFFRGIRKHRPKLETFKKLWKIEESFRINKHTLKMGSSRESVGEK